MNTGCVRTGFHGIVVAMSVFLLAATEGQAQNQMLVRPSGGPYYFDSPVLRAVPGDEFPNSLAVHPVEPHGDSVVIAGSEGAWHSANTAPASANSLASPTELQAVEGLRETSLRRIRTGRVGSGSLLTFMLATTEAGGSRLFRVGPGESSSVNFVLPARDMAVSTYEGKALSDSIICVVSGARATLVRFDAAGGLQVVDEVVLPGAAEGVHALPLMGRTGFAMAGVFEADGIRQGGVLLLYPDQPGAEDPGYRVLAMSSLRRGTESGPIGDDPGAHFLRGTGTPVLIATADLEGDETPEIVVATRQTAGSNIGPAGTGYVYIFDLNIELGGDDNLEVEFNEVMRMGNLGQPSALAIGDLGSTDEQRDGFPEVIVADRRDEKGWARLRVFSNTSRFSGFWPEQTLSLTAGGSRALQNAVQDLANFDPATALLTDLAVARINDDRIPDLVIANPNGNELLVLRGQPPPVATFITVATHGHRGTNSIMQASVWGLSTEERVLDEYNQRLGRVVADINVLRRGEDPVLAPVRHIGISGHWGELTEKGATLQVLGRGCWLGSEYVIWVPTCCAFFPALPSATPVDFWISSVWLVIPSSSPVLPCFLAGPDLGAYFRFTTAALGAGSEFLGACRSSAASRQAALELANRLSSAITDARASMDPCKGQIYVDLNGHSRGTTVTTQALRILPTPLLRFNAGVTVTYLDAIDSTPDDQWRPWARSGHFVKDPLVNCGVGNEKISDIHAELAAMHTGLLADIVPFVTNDEPENFLLQNIIGTPIGHDRSENYGTDAELLGPKVFDEDMDHGNPALYWEEAQITRADTSLPDEFSVESTTILGGFFPGSTWGPREDPVPDFPGWVRATDPCVSRTADPSGEEARLPPACRGETGEDLAGAAAAAEAARRRAVEVSKSAFGDERVRELVADWDFNASLGVVRSARDFESLRVKLDKERILNLNTALPTTLRKLIRKIADEAFVPDNVWSRGRVAGELKKNRVRLSGVGKETPRDRLRQVIKGTGSFPDETDETAVKQFIKQRGSDLKTLAKKEPGAFGEQVDYYTRLLSGSINLEEAFAVFPDASSAGLAQEIHPSSILHRRLFLTVDLEFTGREGVLQARVATRKFDRSLPFSNLRQTHVFELPERKTKTDWIRDELELTGRQVKLYSVSVRPEGPFTNQLDGKIYDLRVFENGIDWEYARTLAERSVHGGKKGRLATVRKAEVYKAIQEHYGLDTFVWLGANGTSESGRKFTWLDGVKAEGPWQAAASFPVPNKLTVFAMGHPLKDGPVLGYAPAKTRHENRSIGLVICYSDP